MGSRDERSLRHTRLVAAASAFVRAIALGRRRWAASVQQDLLNLLNLWFRFGRQSDVEALLLADCDQDEFLDSNLEDDNDDAAFLAAAAAARASPLHQPPINAETKADPVNNAAAAAREIQAGSAPHVTTTSLLSSAVRAHAPGVRPFTPPPRPYSPLSSSTGGRRTGIRGTPLDAWLGVLPQLIARIGASDASPRSALHRLLARLGARHPQALVYPLSLQLKSPRDERRTAAAAILLAPRRVAPQLVEQALLVSEELIRVAILWHEKWHEGLEEASRLYFGDADVDAMLAILRPLHAELEAGPHTMREHAFQQAFGRDLADASRCLDEYERAAEALAKLPPASTSRKSSKNTARRARRRGSRERGPVSEEQSAAAMAGGNRADEIEPGGVSGSQEPGSSNDDEEARKRLRNQMDSALNQAWDLYYTVFRRVNKQLPQLTMLELKYVSPALVNARNLELAVPGTYRVDGTAARILRFGSAVHVITSKQRPRRLAMRGSDGREYGFLLKGHEDLRQDERAMQLFGLANALLAKDRRTCEHGHLLIQRYAVTPLSHNCGVVGWVPASDTLHALVRDFREARKIVLNVEHRVMLQLAPDYDALTLAQKVEVFEAALADVAGQDLSKVLWLKSAHSEQWLERRTHYTRSLATMSMVGHILGLGDRHPSNLMLDRRTGKILHIDFGDCFEVAMHRDKFPERVPFRLTRMLVNAMEVSGVEGTFRSSCERVMRVLRHNRDSLLSMLEAFIHDPLISWRLLGGTVEPEIGDLSEKPGTNLSGDPSVDATKSGSARRDDGARSSTGRDSMSATRDDGRSDEDDEDEGDDGDDEEDRVRSELKEGREDESDDQSDDDDDEVGSDDGRSDNEEEHTDDEYRSDESNRMARMIQRQRQQVSQQQQQQRSSMHLKMSRMAASLSANSTRYSAHSVHDASNSRGNRNSVVGSIANSRLDHRSARERDLVQTLGEEGAEAPIEVLNEKAVAVMARVEDKLTGCDFDDAGALSIVEQVDRLIQQATDVQNLCQAFVGWCPFW
ncbi:hypothetical protein CTAYLR_002279 [Chrysophaeum taylorii]|uniref:non-specific serine/threonine protein kinase n=1 Tax=Chrysophaeum taylorii TaxID=2483200 RepID=A0AAD7UNT9_9STRA|nr:hypothetical protein CTAYLR_002279 [Chrysophaeum taylorii]